MLITFCFCLGDVKVILSNPNVMPFVQTFLIVTESHVGTFVMTAILIMLTTFGCITNVATASRQMFAFARDRGLPFSTFLSYVSALDINSHMANTTYTFVRSDQDGIFPSTPLPSLTASPFYSPSSTSAPQRLSTPSLLWEQQPLYLRTLFPSAVLQSRGTVGSNCLPQDGVSAGLARRSTCLRCYICRLFSYFLFFLQVWL